jgi:hypothetical protein
LPCSDTVAVFVTVRNSDHKNASRRSAVDGKGSGLGIEESQRSIGGCPVSECTAR